MITAEVRAARLDRFLKQQASVLDFATTGKRTMPWLLERLQRIVDEPDPQREWREKWDREFPGKGEDVMELIGRFYEFDLMRTEKGLILQPPPERGVATLYQQYHNLGCKYVLFLMNEFRFVGPTSDIDIDSLQQVTIGDDYFNAVSGYMSYGGKLHHDRGWRKELIQNVGWGREAYTLQVFMWQQLYLTLIAAASSVLDDQMDRRHCLEKQRTLKFILDELWLRGNFPLGVETTGAGKRRLVILVEMDRPLPSPRP